MYGQAWATVDGQVQNVTEIMLSEGLAEVRQTGKQNELILGCTLGGACVVVARAYRLYEK